MERRLDAVLGLFERTNWRMPLRSGLVERKYNRISTLCFIKAALLPYLVPIPSETALARAIQTNKLLQQTCGFHPGNLPGATDFWHFRKKYADVYDLVVLYGLIAVALGEGNGRLELPYVRKPEEVGVPAEDLLPIDITGDRFGRRIRIVANSRTGDELAPRPGEASTKRNDRLLKVQEDWKRRLRGSKDLREYRERVSMYEAELRRISRESRSKGGTGQLYLPALVSIDPGTNNETTFAIDTPSWFSARTHGSSSEVNGEWFQTIRRGEFQRACNVLVIRKDDDKEKILLSKRLDTGYGAGTYAVPGGKQRPDESLEECSRRELLEETNLTLVRSRPVSLYHTKTKRYGVVLTVGVLAEEYAGDLVTLEPEYHAGWKWYELDNLPEPLFEPTTIAISQYRDNIYPDLSWRDVEAREPDQQSMF